MSVAGGTGMPTAQREYLDAVSKAYRERAHVATQAEWEIWELATTVLDGIRKRLLELEGDPHQ